MQRTPQIAYFCLQPIKMLSSFPPAPSASNNVATDFNQYRHAHINLSSVSENPLQLLKTCFKNLIPESWKGSRKIMEAAKF